MRRACLILASLCMLTCLCSCGPVHSGLEGISKIMPEDKTVKCPYCSKKISDQDRRCPFCGRDVYFDTGNDMVDKETQQLTVEKEFRESES